MSLSEREESNGQPGNKDEDVTNARGWPKKWVLVPRWLTRGGSPGRDATGLRYGHIVTVEWWCLAIDAPPVDSNGAPDNQHGTARGSGVHSPAAKADVRRFTMHGICEPPARVTNRTEHGN